MSTWTWTWHGHGYIDITIFIISVLGRSDVEGMHKRN